MNAPPQIAPFPSWIEPMRATLTDERFSSEEWIFEPKLDGERCLAYRRGSSVRLYSANKQTLNVPYPELVRALASQRGSTFILDGEVAAFENGRTSFARLQQRMHIHDPAQAAASPVAIFYYVFDLLYWNGQDLRSRPLVRRKALLQKAIRFGGPLVYTSHVSGQGQAYYAEACRQGWEGLIAKRAASPYVAGRSSDWLKFKCVLEQEFVVGGYTDPEGARTGFGALLVGYYANGVLRYAGKVGTGYTQRTLNELLRQLENHRVSGSPFGDLRFAPRGVHWVNPVLVAQVGFAEWTTDGKLRQGRFLGLRRDKAPREVMRERPVEEAAKT